MKRFFTLFAILVIWAVAAEAGSIGFPPLRIAVTNPVPETAQVLVIDVLTSTGAAFHPAIAITIDPKNTDASGVISYLLVTTTPIDLEDGHDDVTWGTCAESYDKDYLVRVTYHGVVLSIERMEVMYAKQGPFGTTIGADDIDKTETFVFHDISVGSLTPGTVEAKQLVMKDGQVTPKTITLQTPPDMSTNPSYTLTYPTTVGAVNQVLANDATTPGKLVWADASGGGTLPVASGGTGLTSYTIGNMLYASDATTLSVVPTNTEEMTKYLSQYASGRPTWTSEIDATSALDLIKSSGDMNITNYNTGAGTGDIILTPGSLNSGVKLQGVLKILESSGSPTNYTTFQGGDQSGEITYTLPTAAPNVTGQVLSATTGGVMSWADVPAVSSTPKIYTGSAAPEGSVSGKPGDIYIQTSTPVQVYINIGPSATHWMLINAYA